MHESTFERFDIMDSMLKRVMYTIGSVPTGPRSIHAPSPAREQLMKDQLERKWVWRESVQSMRIRLLE